MAKFNEEELAMLRHAKDAHPRGIEVVYDHESAQYAALVRLHDAKLIHTEKGSLMGPDGRMKFVGRITEAGRNVLDEVNEQGEVYLDDEVVLLGLKEGREIIICHVRNMHSAGNDLDMRVTTEDVEKAEVEVGKSGPKVVKRLLTEWLPNSMAGQAVKTLFDLLKAGLG